MLQTIITRIKATAAQAKRASQDDEELARTVSSVMGPNCAASKALEDLAQRRREGQPAHLRRGSCGNWIVGTRRQKWWA